MLGLAEAQRTRQSVDGGDRGADGAALLEADIPVDADAGELGDLLAAEARGAPPAACGQPDRLRRQLFAAGAEEIAEFDAGRPWSYALMEGPRNTRIIPGLLCPSKVVHIGVTRP
jgi:hypothetical protein